MYARPERIRLKIALSDVLPRQAQNVLVNICQVEYQPLWSLGDQQKDVNAFNHLEHMAHGKRLVVHINNFQIFHYLKATRLIPVVLNSDAEWEPNPRPNWGYTILVLGV
jgi:hypothetical protein